jgi:hypothetical protein
VTTGCARSICGNLETSAARIARSAQSDEASDSLSSRQRLHGAVPGARRPWTSTSGRTTTAGSAAAQRPGTADATTQATIMPRRLTTPISLVSGASRLLESLTRRRAHRTLIEAVAVPVRRIALNMAGWDNAARRIQCGSGRKVAVVDWFRISGVRLIRIVGTDDQRISGGFELDLASGARLGFRLSI